MHLEQADFDNIHILYIYIYFFDPFPEWFIAFSFFAREFVNGIMAISPILRQWRHAAPTKRRFLEAKI